MLGEWAAVNPRRVAAGECNSDEDDEDGGEGSGCEETCELRALEGVSGTGKMGGSTTPPPPLPPPLPPPNRRSVDGVPGAATKLNGPGAVVDADDADPGRCGVGCCGATAAQALPGGGAGFNCDGGGGWEENAGGARLPPPPPPRSLSNPPNTKAPSLACALRADMLLRDCSGCNGCCCGCCCGCCICACGGPGCCAAAADEDGRTLARGGGGSGGRCGCNGGSPPPPPLPSPPPPPLLPLPLWLPAWGSATKETTADVEAEEEEDDAAAGSCGPPVPEGSAKGGCVDEAAPMFTCALVAGPSVAP
jgi:hypothetical protein